MRADIRHAAKLIMKLDEQRNLWQYDKSEDATTGPSNNGSSTLSQPRNPLLKNITDYLIEEASAEEAELLGTSVEDPLVTADLDPSTNEENNENLESSKILGEGTILERDDDLIKVLDRLLFYLRIVHSVDYYNHCEYPNEDEMPNRIGLIHARGLISSARVTSIEIAEYIKEQENKIQPLLQASPIVTPEEAIKLGLKNIDDSVEAFIKENTKELGEGKWLCPLSNKKFMGPEFVRKHILNKHMERVEQVKADTEYFNNYIMDAKRPLLPEHPSNRPNQPPSQNSLLQNPLIRHEPLPMPGYAGGGFGNSRVNQLPMYGGYNRYGGGGYMLPFMNSSSSDPYAARPGIKRR